MRTQLDVSVYSRSSTRNLGWDADGVENMPQAIAVYRVNSVSEPAGPKLKS